MPSLLVREAANGKQTGDWLSLVFHGADLFLKDDKEACGECFNCGKKDKLYVQRDTGKWWCHVCQESGNVYSFLLKLWNNSRDRTTQDDYNELAYSRSLLMPGTLYAWGAAKSILTSEWLIPGYSRLNKMVQLYVYRKQNDGKMLLMGTKGLGHGILKPIDTINKTESKVYIAESWSAIALWETIHNSGKELRGEVLGIPGCGSIGKPFSSWVSLLDDKEIIFMLDNDHDREFQGKTIAGSGLKATQRAVKILGENRRMDSIKFLAWGNTAQQNTELFNGYDIRDALQVAGDMQTRVKIVKELFTKIRDIPDDWIIGSTIERYNHDDIGHIYCSSWQELTDSWKKHFVWLESLDTTLAVMLAAILSVNQQGDQVWLRVLGPPSCGKSTLCEALSTNMEHVIAKSVIKGLHSGFRSGDNDEDNSLIVKASGKTLVIKDADTQTNLPNRLQVLSEFRDIYDGSSRAFYRNKIDREYVGIRMGLILCGTEAIKNIDNSQLGERFLDCIVSETLSENDENRILLQAINSAEQSVNTSINGQLAGHYDKRLLQSMRLTGGYISWLADNRKLIENVSQTEEDKLTFLYLAKFISYMRMKPFKSSYKNADNAAVKCTDNREYAIRIAKQLTRLARCLAVVLNSSSINKEVIEKVVKVAIDSSKGWLLDIVKHLYEHPSIGVTHIAMSIECPGNVCIQLLKLLRKTKVVCSIKDSFSNNYKWKLQSRFVNLYEKIKELQ